MLIAFVVLACHPGSNPISVVQQYYKLLSQLQFSQLLPLIDDQALLETAFLQGIVAEMSPADQVQFQNFQVTIQPAVMDDTSSELCHVAVTLMRDQPQQHTLTLTKKENRWVITHIDGSSLKKDFYVY